jgi:hypothetical protein
LVEVLESLEFRGGVFFNVVDRLIFSGSRVELYRTKARSKDYVEAAMEHH